MRKCATDPGNFYHTNTPQEILDAVQKIADDIAESTLRLTN